MTGLDPNTHYRFLFFRVFDGQDISVPEGGGEFRTFPAEGSAVKFSVAFGSCSGNKRNVAQTAWTGITNLAADPAVDSINQQKNVRMFLHLGDTFYFYDDVTGKEPKGSPELLAAHLSQRRHPKFLEMAHVVPCCAVWDDHDFRKNNEDSAGFEGKGQALTGFLDYWGNNPLASGFGLTTLITYGNVDLYLLDGRFLRDKDKDTAACFTQVQLNRILALISARGAAMDRVVILASGSTWNHTNTDDNDEAYGNAIYSEEREFFYGELNRRLGNEIKGLVFLSGDIHRNEIYEIVLPPPPDTPNAQAKVAPEFVSSPMGPSEALKDSPSAITGERKVSHPSEGELARRGFATVEIDTTNVLPDSNWAVTVRYYSENASETAPYESHVYVLTNGQFALVS